jgi:peptidyl-tRNA hydrolase
MTHKKSKNNSKGTNGMKDVKDTSCAKRGSSKPMTKNFIDIEAGIKKDKEVKEKDVFNFSYHKNPKSVRK